MSKRRRFILIAIILSLSLVLIQKVALFWRYQAIILLSIFSYLVSAHSLREDLKKISFLTSLPTSFLFTLGAGLFSFLIPQSITSFLWWQFSLEDGKTFADILKFIGVLLFGVGNYSLLLTCNIFNVSIERNIQLLRVAQAVGFSLKLITAFLLFDSIFSFKLSSFENMIFVFLVSCPLVFSGIWEIDLGLEINKRSLIFASVISFAVAQAAFFISFWPVAMTIASIFLVSLLYVQLGLTQQLFLKRLFRKTIWEYLQIGIIAFILLTIIVLRKW